MNVKITALIPLNAIAQRGIIPNRDRWNLVRGRLNMLLTPIAGVSCIRNEALVNLPCATFANGSEALTFGMDKNTKDSRKLL